MNWLTIDYMAVTCSENVQEKKTQHLWQQTSEYETQKSGLDIALYTLHTVRDEHTVHDT